MGRSLEPVFLNEFLGDGSLSPLLKVVHNDTTLDMELRGNEVKIYYRGRLLITVEQQGYSIKCNDVGWKNYNEVIGTDSACNFVPKPSVDECIHNISLYKAWIDVYLSTINSELEEQAKQQLVLENNVFFKNNDKSSDYFILDTEYEVNSERLKARFDAIALRWPSIGSVRGNRKDLGISFIEMKYGDEAKNGTSGLREHIDDYKTFVESAGTKEMFCEMCKDMETVFEQKCKLGLIPSYNQCGDEGKIKIKIDPQKVDMVFVFVNSDPESKSVEKEWQTICEKYKEDDLDHIYVARASDVGYALFRYGRGGKNDDRFIKISKYYEMLFPHISIRK